MLNMTNLPPRAFQEHVHDKEVFLFGAGRALEGALKLYFENKPIKGIIDNNPSLHGQTINHNHCGIPIMNLNEFVQYISSHAQEQCTLFITSPFYATEIVDELDRIQELDGLECFLQALVRENYGETDSFDFTRGVPKIARTIHYIWLGGKAIPKAFQENIDSWRKYNPQYEIVEWNETNYHFDKCLYAKQAYETGNWGFASNYARLDIIYQEGGIYLDTDVEVIRSFDPLINDDAFFCMGKADRVNNGCGFGAIKNHPIVKNMMESYENSCFLDNNGKPKKQPGFSFLHPSLAKWGFEFNNQYQKRKGAVLYPVEVMSPLSAIRGNDRMTDKTRSIHKESGSWMNEKEKEGMEKLNRFVTEREIKFT